MVGGMLTVLRVLFVCSVILCPTAANSQTVVGNFSFLTSYSGQGFSGQSLQVAGEISYDSSTLSAVGQETIRVNVTNFWMSHSIGNTDFDSDNVEASLLFSSGKPFILTVGGLAGFNSVTGVNALVGAEDDFLWIYSVNHPNLSNFSLSSLLHPNHGPWVNPNAVEIDFGNSGRLTAARPHGAVGIAEAKASTCTAAVMECTLVSGSCCQCNESARLRIRSRAFCPWKAARKCSFGF